MENLAVAEDIASETFLSALESWPYKGVPANPTGWLHVVARHKALNYLRRSRTFANGVAPALAHGHATNEPVDIDLSDANITDSQLRMLFALCHPAIPVPSQVALALRILCGFGIDEIASAFLTSRETVNKRLFRAKEKLRTPGVTLEFPTDEEIPKRLDAVLTTLYLLFSEGYYSETDDAVIREDLCLEAMRLTHLLADHPATGSPHVHALLALMCFQASRFAARRGNDGRLILYNDQDTSRWNKELIARGAEFLHKASHGDVSRYHLEATIAYWHTVGEDVPEKWETILKLYDCLLVDAYSPIAALNRLYALSRVYGKQIALAEAEELNLENNRYYYALLAELNCGIDNAHAMQLFWKALSLTTIRAETQILRERIKALSGK
jgi:RNA polymerase sigma-70 factor (ECF subfamily)